MTGYQATFTKKDGSPREIRFVRTDDMPEKWFAKHVNEGFRIFNLNTVQGKVEKFDYLLDKPKNA